MFLQTPLKTGQSPADADTWTVEEKSSWLASETKEFLSGVMLKQEDFTNRVSNIDAAHRKGFSCCSPNCQTVFLLHSSRVRYV